VNTEDPNTLVMTAADSDAGGMQIFQFAPYTRPAGNFTSDPAIGDTEPQVPFININPSPDSTRNYLDGANGSTGSEEAPWEAFQSVDSIDGPMGNFAIAWVGTPDFPGSIVAKTYGLNADLLPSTLDNTEIYKIMHKTLFGEPKPPTTVYGTPGDDSFDTAIPDDRRFVGNNQILFTGSGNDTVDVTFAVGGNRIDLGSGDDILFGGSNNRILAGSGDDILYIGSGGGNNVITGGLGADQFWVVTDTVDLPSSANTISDFVLGTDVIGFANTSLDFTGLTIVQEGQNTLIQALDREIVRLLNLQASSLTEANFVFA
jgi:glycerophosphoryl diester phosphodiesterase